MRSEMIAFASSHSAHNAPARAEPSVRSSALIDSRRPLPIWPPLRPLAPHPIRAASSTITEYPRSARCRAAEIPVNPAPTMQTSAVSRPASAGWRSPAGAVAAYQDSGNGTSAEDTSIPGRESKSDTVRKRSG